MIPCSNCRYFATDYIWDIEDLDGEEYEVPICLKDKKMCLSNGDECEQQSPYKNQRYNIWDDYFENYYEDE